MTKQEALKIAKPILFNTEMVRAILEKRKTVTRRLIKPQPESVVKTLAEETVTPLVSLARFLCTNGEREWIEGIKMSYQKGDILYIRETWSPVYVRPERFLYKTHCPEAKGWPVKWRPSIHMPKEAARIFLRVTDVRVERLQDITEDGAKAEGMPDDCDYPVDKIYCPICKGKGLVGTHYPGTLGFVETECAFCETFVERFINVWNSTVKKSDRDKYGWEANPWVYVIEFERIEVE